MIDISLHGVQVVESRAASSQSGLVRLSARGCDYAPASLFCSTPENARAIGEAFIALADEMDKAGRVAA